MAQNVVNASQVPKAQMSAGRAGSVATGPTTAKSAEIAWIEAAEEGEATLGAAEATHVGAGAAHHRAIGRTVAEVEADQVRDAHVSCVKADASSAMRRVTSSVTAQTTEAEVARCTEAPTGTTSGDTTKEEITRGVVVRHSEDTTTGEVATAWEVVAWAHHPADNTIADRHPLKIGRVDTAATELLVWRNKVLSFEQRRESNGSKFKSDRDDERCVLN